MAKLVFDKKGFGIFENGNINSLLLEEKGDVCARYNAFEQGGAVERLVEWAGRVLRVHIPVQDYLYENGRAILAELEALLPAESERKI